MKLVVGLAALLISATAVAQPPGDTPPVAPDADLADPYAGAQRGEWKQRLKAKFDTDHDGVLSPEERWVAKQAIRRHRMRRLDRDHDGRVGPRDRTAMRARRFDRAIRRFDRDGDGVLGPGEVPPRLIRKLRRLDANGDGWLTRDEIVNARGRARMRDRMRMRDRDRTP
jgi:hypothetical protein